MLSGVPLQPECFAHLTQPAIRKPTEAFVQPRDLVQSTPGFPRKGVPNSSTNSFPQPKYLSPPPSPPNPNFSFHRLFLNQTRRYQTRLLKPGHPSGRWPLNFSGAVSPPISSQILIFPFGFSVWTLTLTHGQRVFQKWRGHELSLECNPQPLHFVFPNLISLAYLYPNLNLPHLKHSLPQPPPPLQSVGQEGVRSAPVDTCAHTPECGVGSRSDSNPAIEPDIFFPYSSHSSSQSSS